jgi:hypothetical protein
MILQLEQMQFASVANIEQSNFLTFGLKLQAEGHIALQEHGHSYFCT